MHLYRAMLALTKIRRRWRSRGPGQLSARAYGCEYMYQWHLHVKWEAQGSRANHTPRTPEEGVITAAYCFRAQFCTCEAHGNAVTPFKLTATNNTKKMQNPFCLMYFKLCRSRSKCRSVILFCVREYPKTLCKDTTQFPLQKLLW